MRICVHTPALTWTGESALFAFPPSSPSSSSSCSPPLSKKFPGSVVGLTSTTTPFPLGRVGCTHTAAADFLRLRVPAGAGTGDGDGISSNGGVFPRLRCKSGCDIVQQTRERYIDCGVTLCYGSRRARPTKEQEIMIVIECLSREHFPFHVPSDRDQDHGPE